MDGWTDGWAWAEKCKKAPGVIPHHGVLQAGIGFGVTPTLVCPEGLWMGVGVGRAWCWVQGKVLGCFAGAEAPLGCWRAQPPNLGLP